MALFVIVFRGIDLYVQFVDSNVQQLQTGYAFYGGRAKAILEKLAFPLYMGVYCTNIMSSAVECIGMWIRAGFGERPMTEQRPFGTAKFVHRALL